MLGLLLLVSIPITESSEDFVDILLENQVSDARLVLQP